MSNYSKKSTVYKTASFVVALGFFVYSFTTFPVQGLVGDTSSLLGSAVGVFAGVPENPYNSLAAQLQEKEDALNAREAALAEREDSQSFIDSQSTSFGLYSLGISSLVLLLVVLNFYFDWRRNRRTNIKSESYSVNLKRSK